MRSSVHTGYLLALLGIIILSPDALLIRILGSDPWAVTAWRGLLGGIMILVYNQWLDRRSLRVQCSPAGYWFFASVLQSAVSNFAFVYAITHANVTDVLVIIAFTPLLSALLSAVFLGERVALRTWVATLVCGVGLAILLSQSGSQSQTSGLLATMVCAVLMAGQFVIIRAFPAANLTPTIGLGSMLSGLVSLVFAGSLVMNQGQVLALAVTVLLVLSVPYVLFVLSLRYISAAETSLIMLLESVLGSLWVWFFLAERPSLQTALSGILILSTLTVYGVLVLRDTRQESVRIT